jgi:hypothetical protein
MYDIWDEGNVAGRDCTSRMAAISSERSLEVVVFDVGFNLECSSKGTHIDLNCDTFGQSSCQKKEISLRAESQDMRWDHS